MGLSISKIFKKLLLSRALTISEDKVEILGLKGVIIPLSAFCDFQKKMIEGTGEKKTHKTIKSIGISQGNLAFKSGILKFGKLGEKFLELEVSLAEMLGWGKFKLINLNVKKATGVVHVNSNFAKEYGKSKNPVDFFLEGLIEGFAESFSDRKIVCKETQCIGMGHNYCEFAFGPKR
jgi:predicted hydrocarbon binding protein